jgi:hypothetical protein
LRRPAQIADLDRLVSRIDIDPAERRRLANYRDVERYVLLGEPGIGKSTAFEREAKAVGTEPVSAMAFVRGKRPPGGIVFVDGLEEYRIGEAGVDRLQDLIDALEQSEYTGWRIACRAISLAPADALRVAAALGEFAMLQLELLDRVEQYALLRAIRVSDPSGYVERVASLGADALLGNPTTLILLSRTIDHAPNTPTTRAALFAEATRQMSHELNEQMPERRDRPAPAEIEAAAEAACLVLMLSARTDLYLYSGIPPHDEVVTRDDLRPSQVDTEALKAAVDTPMFKSDGVTFQPSHRIVAEYLAGRALARAVVPPDGKVPALPLYRALGFCCGDNDSPAPALTGVFAWFVTALAQSRRPELAASLIPLDPEAVLFHGDAAALPTEQRAQLLDIVGRGDPWFHGALRGSSAIGGLAGDDLVVAMRTLLADPGEGYPRKTMVLEALSNGRPVPALAEDVRALVTTPSANEHYRLRALDAWLSIVGDTAANRQAMLAALAGEPAATAAVLRIELITGLVDAEAIEADALRAIIVDYAGTGDLTMGHAHALLAALERHPVAGLFDAPIAFVREPGVARSFESRSVIDHALAAALAATPTLDGERLVRWTVNAGSEGDRVEPLVVAGIAAWLDQDAAHESELYHAITAAIERKEEGFWRADFDYRRLSGRSLSLAFRTRAVEAVERDSSDLAAADRAIQLILPFDGHCDLYWRLFAALEGHTAAAEQFTRLTVEEVPPWRKRNAEYQQQLQRKTDERFARDREWLRPRIPELLRGDLTGPAVFTAEVYHGHRNVAGADGVERINCWLGGDAALIEAVRAALQAHVSADPATIESEGKMAAGNRWWTSELVVSAWADWLIREGQEPDLPLPLAIRLLRHTFGADECAERLKRLARARIERDPDAQAKLVQFWRTAIKYKPANLPLAHSLDAASLPVRGAAEVILRGRQALSIDVLSDLVALAAPGMTAASLLAIAERMLKRQRRVPGHRLWALVAFLLDPANHTCLLDSELSDAEGATLLLRLWDGHHGEVQALASDKIVPRSDALIRHLGPNFAPGDRLADDIDRPSELVANSIVALSRQHSDDAVATLEALGREPDLAAWKYTIAHHLAAQAKAIREARFRPPLPHAVACALAAGPPASAADLRAVIRHTIEELALDIRRSDTASWRLFWNRPFRGTATPKIENDCRDLIVDRLRDRLERYGIPVRNAATEARSIDDKRADLVVLGDGASAVPVEAKRHWNNEIWTAIEDQLIPYGLSVGSSGHGIYLIFWFGIGEHKVPRPGAGGEAPTTPDALKTALATRVPATHVGKIDIVVIDLSEPDPKT